MGEKTEVEEVALEGVLQIADANRALALRPAEGQRETSPPVLESVFPEDEVSLQDPEIAMQPPRHADLQVLAFELHGGAAIERREEVLEALLDGLAPVARLRRQLAPLQGEVAVEDGEADDTLVRRQVQVRFGHDPGEVGLPFFLGRELGEERSLRVRHDEQDVVVAPVAGEERPPDAGNPLEELLHAPRGHGLAPAVLVDVLDPVDDLEKAARPHAKDVPAPDPSLPGARRLRLVDVAGDVRAGDEKLPVLAQTDADPRQRDADGAVLVVTGRCHRDAAGGLRHAEAAAEGDAAALEEAKDRGLQEAGRRQPPGQAPARHFPHGRRFLLRPGRGAEPLLAAFVELLPSGGDADQPGRADLAQAGQERLQRGVPGEDVRSAPEERAEQFQVTPERVVERQIAEKHLPFADERERCRAREAFREQVEGREGESLLGPGAPRREENGGRLVEAEGGERPKRLIRLLGSQLPDLLAENGGGAALQAGSRVEENRTDGA